MPLTVFEGAKVKDAIRSYYAKKGKRLPKKIPVVRDGFGHKVGMDGVLLLGSVLYIEQKAKKLKETFE